MFRVSREIDFCYGHRLLEYDGICKHPHGHNAVAEIEIRTESLDARFICGNAMHLSSWRDANAQGMGLMIAATNDDSTNMLSSLIADRFGIERKIVRTRSIDLIDGGILSLGVMGPRWDGSCRLNPRREGGHS